MSTSGNLYRRPSRAELKSAQRLLTKKGRREAGEFIAEGMKILKEAARFRNWPERVYFDVNRLDKQAGELLELFEQHGVELISARAKELESFCDTVTPQGIVGIFRTARNRPAFRPREAILLCDGINDPGNLGTLLRSALAFEVRTVVLTNNSAEPHSPKTIRSSAGAVFGLSIVELSVDEVLAISAEQNLYLVMTDAKGSTRLAEVYQQAGEKTIVVMIGSEAHGISKELRSVAKAVVGIAHSDNVESLNAGVAGAIILQKLYEHRQEQ